MVARLERDPKRWQKWARLKAHLLRPVRSRKRIQLGLRRASITVKLGDVVGEAAPEKAVSSGQGVLHWA